MNSKPYMIETCSSTFGTSRIECANEADGDAALKLEIEHLKELGNVVETFNGAYLLRLNSAGRFMFYGVNLFYHP